MIRTKRKLRSLFLAFCLLLAIRPQAVLAADGAVMVSGTDILQAPGQTVSCGNGSARYDSGTNTLTLENVNISADPAGNPLLYGIQIERENVTVRLVGTNTVSGHFGISSSHPLRLDGTGGGTLTIRVAQDPGLPGLPCRGIFVEGGGLTVDHADLRIEIGNAGDTNAYALYICGKDNRISNSRIEITAEAQASGVSCQGINGTGADSLTISDHSELVLDNLDSGIAVTGRLAVSGSRVTIKEAGQYGVSCGNLDISAQSEVNVTADQGLALGVDQDISVSASSVQAESRQTNGIFCNGEFEATDASNVTAKGYWPGIFAVAGAVVKDSSVHAEATNDVSIFSKGTVALSGSEVYAPDSIYAHGDISIVGGTTEIGQGNIRSERDVYVGGPVTSDGVVSYDKIAVSSGKVVFSEADYREVDRAVAEAEALKREDYTNFEAVEKAVSAVVRGKDVREQHLVDGYAAAIKAAIAALEPVPAAPKEYQILEGASQTLAVGKNQDVIIKADGEFSKFTGVSVDGKKLADEQYTAVSGSTVITLRAEYVNALAAGTHTVTIHYSDGQVQTTFTLKEGEEPETKPETKPGQDQNQTQKPGQKPTQSPAKNPSSAQNTAANVSPGTGDHAPIGFWLSLMILAGLLVIVEGSRKKG